MDAKKRTIVRGLADVDKQAKDPSLSSLSAEQIWAGAGGALENIYEELRKRLNQLQEEMSEKVLGSAAPTGDVMAVYTKSREQFRVNCSKILQSFGKEFGDLKLKFQKAKYKNPQSKPDTAPIAKLFDKYGKKVAELQASLVELVQKGNDVLGTEQLSMSLLVYWAAHDSVVRQVYNSLVDLDEATRGWVADMTDEVTQIASFRDLLVRESAGYFNSDGEFEINGGMGMRVERLPTKPVFSHPSVPMRLPDSTQWLSFAEAALDRFEGNRATLGGPTKDKRGASRDSIPEEKVAAQAPRWSGPGEGDGCLQGWLRKKSPTAAKSWQQRWFVLQDDQLMYYRSNTTAESTLAESASASSEDGVVELTVMAACFCTTDNKHGGRGIKLIMLDGRTYYLMAYARDHAQKWVSEIRLARQRHMEMEADTEDSDEGEDGAHGPDSSSSEEDATSVDGESVDGDGSSAAVVASYQGGGFGEDEEMRKLHAEASRLTLSNAALDAEIAELERIKASVA